MSLTIPCDIEQLKLLGRDLILALPTATLEEVDAGWKCFGLAYLGCEYKSPRDEIQAVALTKMLSKLVGARTLELELSRANTNEDGKHAGTYGH